MVERNWIRLREDAALRRNLELRSEILAGIRAFFASEGFVEIDPPSLIPVPGMEPHLVPFTTMHLDVQGRPRPFYLHTSPEYALKKLLSAGFERLYAMGHVFRNGEISTAHNPEFTLLEWYRAGRDYRALMDDCEQLLLHLAERLGLRRQLRYQGGLLDLTAPWPRISVGGAMLAHADVDLERLPAPMDLVEVARRKGYEEVSGAWPWEDIFYRIFLQEVEPHLPKTSPFFLVDFPIEMAALARARSDRPRWAERFELYAGGLELANAFSELIDPVEQQRRLMDEKRQRAREGREVFPVDTSFLEALARGMPNAAGIALGIDRLAMLLLDASAIREVIAFPAEDLLEDWLRIHGEEG